MGDTLITQSTDGRASASASVETAYGTLEAPKYRFALITRKEQLAGKRNLIVRSADQQLAKHSKYESSLTC